MTEKAEGNRGTRRARLVEWLRAGDPEKIPVMFWVGPEVAAAHFAKSEREVTSADQWAANKALGLESMCEVSSPTLLTAADHSKTITKSEEIGEDPDGRRWTETTIKGDFGGMNCRMEEPPGLSATWTKHFVETPDEIETWVRFVREGTAEILSDRDRYRRIIADECRRGMAEAGERGPVMLWIFSPVVELTCSLYFSQALGVMFILDEPKLLRELAELQIETTKLWIEAGVKAGVDCYGFAINGLEIYSPAIYEEFHVPLTQPITEMVRRTGKLSWLHCCGKLTRLVEDGVYERIGPDVLESLSAPPEGDVTEMARVRSRLGGGMTTRGGINVGWIHDDAPEDLRRRVGAVIDGCAGFRHMLGGTDQLLYGTPVENIRVLADVVHERKRVFE